jgi:Tfp pilus assembly protein PilN
MLRRLALAVVVAVVVTLACVLLGGILATLQISIAVTIGQFLTQWSGVLGVLAGLWFFFSGYARLNW